MNYNTNNRGSRLDMDTNYDLKLNKYILTRKLLHLSTAILALFYFSKRQYVCVLLTLTVVALVIEVLRFKNTGFSRLFYKFVGKLLWARESHTLTGSTTFLFGALVSAILFDKPVAIAVLLFVTLGDTVAYFVNTIGKIKLFKVKTLEGTIACLSISTIVVLLLRDIKLYPIGLIGALTAAIVELLPLNIDDNISIQLISGALMQVLSHTVR